MGYGLSANSVGILPLSVNSTFDLQNKDNFNKISLQLSPLSNGNARQAEDNKWTAFVLNLIIGMGIGSFIQGDTTGGIIGLCGELGGLTLVIIGASRTETVNLGWGVTMERSNPNTGLITVGSLVFGATSILCHYKLYKRLGKCYSKVILNSEVALYEGKAHKNRTQYGRTG